MRVGKVVGSLSLTQSHPSLKGKRWVLAVPQSLGALARREGSQPEELVVIDELGAQPDDLIGFSEGGEAAFPYFPEKKPVDAYAACIVDDLQLDHGEIAALLAKAGAPTRGTRKS